MKSLLICPSTRPAVEHLTTFAPLAAIPLLGESLVEYWLAYLAMSGTSEVRILANDRPEQIVALTGGGVRWGLKVDVITETRELTAAQAQIKYGSSLNSDPCDIFVLDHFPEIAQSLFTSYADLFAGLFTWLPNARMPDRIGLRETQPGIWTGLHTRISADAKLTAPCWIGHNVYVGPRAVIGPMAVIEDRAFLDLEAEISGSVIGPDTYVGQLTVVQESFAWGNTLINWKSNLNAQIADPLVLSALRRPALAKHPEPLWNRLAELYSKKQEDLQMFWKHLLMDKEG
jgi:NDP-sugar pyrophosphorylase family protein